MSSSRSEDFRMSLAILGLGTSVPSAVYDQDEALQVAQALCTGTKEQTTWLPNMYKQTGIDKRHLCLGRPLVEDVINGTRETQSVFLPKYEPNDSGPTTHERMEVYRDVSAKLAVESCGHALERAHCAAADITHTDSVS